MSAKNYKLGSKYDEIVDAIQIHYNLKNRQDSVRMALDIVFNTLVKEDIKVVPFSFSNEISDIKQLLIELVESNQGDF